MKTEQDRTMEECPYCRIAAGSLAGEIVYQDADCTAFMSIQPFNPGHVLLVPNEHISSLDELPPAKASHFFAISQKLALAVRRSGIPSQDLDVYIGGGKVGSQTARHLILHIIPRFEDDGFEFRFSPRSAELPTGEELGSNAYHISRALREIQSQEQQVTPTRERPDEEEQH